MTITAHSAPSSARYGRASTDAFGDYLRRIGKGALLTAEDEVNLARRIEVGLFAEEKLLKGNIDDPDLERELAWLVHDGCRSKNHFIEANLRLVVSIAKHYSGRGVPIMDLVQDGNIGLVRAVEKFDFMTGYKFSTYATWWIRQAIHRGMADKSRMIRIPVHTAEKLNKIKRIRRDLTSTLDRDPTVRELAEATQIPARDVARLLQYDNEPISLHAPVGDGIGDISELIIDDDLPQPDEYATIALRAADITFYLDALPPRERAILQARFGLDGDAPRTLDQIALIQGVTRERVRQIEKRALALLHVPRLERYLRD
ncbi:RNA polymerase primary sigma factor [Cryobacterium psychrotolerans]|uniref:RNA polymerase sigma factor n=1 Tax=Cryobacterium psychrotolerans TaxID=386301 RepID=A0A1G9D584_9MICO|nr:MULTISPECIES: sigma-70 family RNA polymerase sigma factor [Cryobacterium]TFD41409.1 sigma-70 family RNA polymerase sigma factor [Cryobacterium sp. TMT1-2-1]TFD90287.1 sigma-70 family RNA polymerase sigma factor [Cryobacterium psychrotolerans]SDK59088.1 RNA polymerase primary sigma factor [Cryobacterium psychrotolerans]